METSLLTSPPQGKRNADGSTGGNTRSCIRAFLVVAFRQPIVTLPFLSPRRGEVRREVLILG